MNKLQALNYIVSYPGSIVKLDWWNDFMGIKYENNQFVSIPGVKIELEFLQDGNFLISDYFNDKELGGLFSL